MDSPEVSRQRNYGLPKEDKVLKICQDQFDKNLVKTVGRFNRFDFTSDSFLIELKSRRCHVDTYPTTMVGYNKIEYAKKYPDKQVIFCFNFEGDQLYYHKYQPDKTYDIKPFNNRPYCYIPTSELTKV